MTVVSIMSYKRVLYKLMNNNEISQRGICSFHSLNRIPQRADQICVARCYRKPPKDPRQRVTCYEYRPF